MKNVRLVLSIILLLITLYFVTGELLLPHNTPSNGNLCVELPHDGWVEVKEDGTRVPFEVPGKTDGDIVLETKIPEDFDKEYSVICFRGTDMEIYIEDELRAQMKTEDYDLFGDQSAEAYVMASVFPEDAGKTLRVFYEYNAGVVNSAYIGTRIGILGYLLKKYGLELFVGLSILLLGSICLIAAFVYRLIYKRYLEMEHFSLGAILGAIWVLSNSIFRQFYTSNLSVIANIPYIMVMILPLPFLIFMNSLQNERYSKLLTATAAGSIANSTVCILLFIFGKVNLCDSFFEYALVTVISIFIMISTLFIDMRKKLAKSYRMVIVGFFILALAAIIQIVTFLWFRNGVFSGAIMAFGLFGFLLCSILHTIKQLIGIRVEANEIAHISKAKDDFLANMSHEIRTPLNGILGMDEMILRDTKEAKTRRYALDIRSAGNTLLSIINDILDLSKIESGNFEIIPEEYDVASVLNDVVNMTRPRASKKNIGYSIEVDEQIPGRLYGDEIRIRQIMLNVINNAVKYTQEGHVDIRVYTQESKEEGMIWYAFDVEDTGIGIKEEDKDKLFDSFQRLDEKKNRSIEGTGLGLHITKRVLQMMNGTISFESEYGKGSTFTVKIPQKVVGNESIGEFSKAIQKYIKNIEIDKVALYAPSARILVVDDNEMNLEVMEGLLRDTKIKAEFVNSGLKCIEKVKNNKYDCVLLDQMMPGLSGEATLNEMNEQDIVKDTPIIALTADAIAGARENYLSKGFTDYLSKPVKYAMLEQLLKQYIPPEKQLVKKPEEEIPKILIWGDDSEKLKSEKERLDGIYKCVCVVGEAAKDKYLEKHEPLGVMHIV